MTDGMTYPYPIMGNNGMFGNDGIGALLIGALLFGGGLGGFGANRYGAGAVAGGAWNEANELAFNGLSQQINTLSGQVNSNAVSAKLDTLGSTITGGFADVNSNLCSGFASVNNNICQSTHSLENTINSGNFNLLNAINNGFANSALAACQNTNTLVLQGQNNTNNIISAINGISQKMDQNLITGLQTEKASLQAQLLGLENTHSLSDEIRTTQAQLAACCCQNNSSHAVMGNTISGMTTMEGVSLNKLDQIIALLDKKA